VARFDHIGLARLNVALGAVAVLDMEPTADDRAQLARLARVRLGDGLHRFGQRHPGWKVRRAAVELPILTTSTLVLGGVLVSSGESNAFEANPGMASLLAVGQGR
jgi:hypothetical protein